MSSHRTHIHIIGDVLDCISKSQVGQSAVNIMRETNVSYSRLLDLLDELAQKGLVDYQRIKNTSVYKISNEGIRYLEAYNMFSKSVMNLGLAV